MHMMRLSADSVPTVLTLVAVTVGATVLLLAPHAGDIAGSFIDARQRSFLGVAFTGPELYRLFWVSGGLLGALAFLLVGAWQGRLTAADVAAGPVYALGFVYGAMLEGRSENTPLLEAAQFVPTQLVGPGMRLPLGVLVGGLLSLAWCRATAAPWRLAGDRLAVAAATWEGFGRIGCLMAGCCTGTVCPAWMSSVCLRYPPRTDAFFEQMSTKLIDPTSPLSHPVHVLPVYFALASLALLALLASLLRRNAPAGTLLAVYAVVYAIGKFGLESLRGNPRTGMLMPVVLLTILTLGLLAAPWGARQRVGSSTRREGCPKEDEQSISCRP